MGLEVKVCTPFLEECDEIHYGFHHRERNVWFFVASYVVNDKNKLTKRDVNNNIQSSLLIPGFPNSRISFCDHPS